MERGKEREGGKGHKMDWGEGVEVREENSGALTGMCTDGGGEGGK